MAALDVALSGDDLARLSELGTATGDRYADMEGRRPLTVRYTSSVTGSAPRLPDELGDLTLQTMQVGRRTVLAAAGEIDLITAGGLERAAAEALDRGALELWIDVSDVTFIDSAGIHVLLAVRARVQELDRRLAVICPVGPTRRTLGLTRLDEALPLFASREEAHQRG